MHATEITPLEPGELHLGGPAWRAAEAAGHDMSLIVEALRKPAWERMQMNDAALTLGLMLRKAQQEQHA